MASSARLTRSSGCSTHMRSRSAPRRKWSSAAATPGSSSPTTMHLDTRSSGKPPKLSQRTGARYWGPYVRPDHILLLGHGRQDPRVVEALFRQDEPDADHVASRRLFVRHAA